VFVGKFAPRLKSASQKAALRGCRERSFAFTRVILLLAARRAVEGRMGAPIPAT
jgi:hypothetical protein